MTTPARTPLTTDRPIDTEHLVSHRPTYDPEVRIYASIRPKRIDGSDEEPESVEISAEGDSYEDARPALDAKVPDGWQMLSISRWPCHPGTDDQQ